VLFSGYRPTWEGGARPHRGEDAFEQEDAGPEGPKDAAGRPPGGATINSGEARDFLLGGCASQMACTDCHDPHASDGFGDRRAGMGKVCERCHAQYTTPAQIAAHTHHRADGPGAECLSCHMPRKNMGLDYRLTRYHRVGSPTDPARVLHDRPLECALCHDDKSAREIVDTMSAWWNKTYDRGALSALYGGDLGRNVLSWTLAAGRPHERAAAAAVLAGKRRRDAAAQILPVLSDERPLVRYFAREALESLVGTPFPWDVGESDAERPARAARWLDAR
jgi:predicted CXXCH cytochrome family protein